MSEAESFSISRAWAASTQARPAHREVADLLAAAIVLARLRGRAVAEVSIARQNSEVCLGFYGDQSVHVNPSQTQGVQE